MTNVTIALTRFAEPNWLVQEALESLSRQRNVTATVLFLDQQDDKQLRDYVADLSNQAIHFIYERIPAKSLSYARNHAINVATGDIVLFIDSDAIAADDWAESLTQTLVKDNVAIVGGKILPKWHRLPLVVARAQLIQEQYSLLDLGDEERASRKVVGANFGIHKGRLGIQAYFDESLGRRDGLLLGGEEVELCHRAREAGWSVLYNGHSVVRHQILPERICYRWILQRFYYGGISRALLGGKPGMTHRSAFWDYLVLPLILPSYALGYFEGRRRSTLKTKA